MITPNAACSPPARDRRVGARRPLLWVFIAAFVLCSLLDLISEAVGWDRAADVFRMLALPLLACALFAARPPITRTVVLLVGGLLFSWLGDSLGEFGFMVKIMLFLIAQWFFIGAFWSYRQRSLLRRPVAVLGYALLLVILTAVLIRRADELAIPVVVYGASLVTMAILASGLNRWGMIGGLCFVFSDTLLGMHRFYRLPAADLMDFLIMLSYLLAEAFLVRGVVAAASHGQPRKGVRGRGRYHLRQPST